METVPYRLLLFTTRTFQLLYLYAICKMPSLISIPDKNIIFVGHEKRY